MTTETIHRGEMTAAPPDSAPPPALSEGEVARRDELAGRLCQSAIFANELLSVHFGSALGLYRALADDGPATSSELAARAATDERYTREWLEQQAVAGLLDVETAADDGRMRRYGLPPGHAEVLLDRDSESHLAPLAQAMAAIGPQIPALLEAYRSGRGVPYEAYGADAVEAQEFLNRPAFVNLLGTEWLPAIRDVHARLQAEPSARVADIGCGAGWSSIAIARAYPKARVDGFDLDAASIARARASAAAAGVADRVTFHVRDASDLAVPGEYDLVVAFEMIHDLGRPVETLRGMRRLAGERGAVVVMDEGVDESLSAPGSMIERLFYGFSLFWCLPQGLADTPSVGTGTIIRPGIMRRYAQEAGFREVEVLPIEHDAWRFYRLVA